MFETIVIQVLFTKNTLEEKLQFIFQISDQDQNGFLDLVELTSIVPI